MAFAAFDTLQIFEDLEKAGFEESKAKAISIVVRKAHESSDFATKRDIDDLHKDMNDLHKMAKKDIDDLRKDMDAKHESLRKDIDTQLANLKFELLKWFFGIALAQTGLLGALKLWV